jgi:dethiobiotin synthetase/adenosylmethionine--8-amino-7-oxononanoate aminotransferase
MQPIMEIPIGDQSSTPFGIHFRTLGNVAYFMTSLNTPYETIRSVEERIRSTLQQVL